MSDPVTIYDLANTQPEGWPRRLVNPADLRRYFFATLEHDWSKEECRGCGRVGWRHGEKPWDGRATGVPHRPGCDVARMLDEPSVTAPPRDEPYGPLTLEQTVQRDELRALYRHAIASSNAVFKEVYR